MGLSEGYCQRGGLRLVWIDKQRVDVLGQFILIANTHYVQGAKNGEINKKLRQELTFSWGAQKTKSKD